ncbi:MAG TPA: hypothetical protein VKB79_06425 [Bryobacteraceae bacterium]|nr:hypothetical protein [Bryobacteraceae bacterium]
MQSIRDWYCFSRDHRRHFLAGLGENTNAALVTLLQNELNQAPIKSLRTLEEIKNYKRESLPRLADLKQRKPDEQHLQYLFMHRGYFRQPFESVLTREYPSCDRRNERSAVIDLLGFDNKRKEPLIVELKRAEASDPLFGVVLEALHHWAFFSRNSRLLAAVLRRGGYDCPDTCSVQLAIAAPTEYYVVTQRRSATSPARNREYSRTIDALTYLAARTGLNVPLVAIDDNWRDTGTDFPARLWWQVPTAEQRG